MKCDIMSMKYANKTAQIGNDSRLHLPTRLAYCLGNDAVCQDSNVFRLLGFRYDKFFFFKINVMVVFTHVVCYVRAFLLFLNVTNTFFFLVP